MTNDLLSALEGADPSIEGFAPIAGMALIGLCVMAIILLVSYLALWKIFTKAGYAGWKCLIPFYNQYILCKISFGLDKGWYFIFSFIPLVSYVFPFVLEYKLCKAFNKGVGFIILAMFFTPITRLILGFGDSEYINKPSEY
jgi:hypothetical protein